MATTPKSLVTQLLKETSRSFNLTLSVLPGAIRFQIRLAYLLARTTDTIADTEIVPPSERVAALNAYFDTYRSGDEYDRSAITHVMACNSHFPGLLLDSRSIGNDRTRRSST